ncbi:hypothetical protein [Bacillus pumilus]|uniref:hypothetical protein n=1 Tax=Bacillus pumilus TaxID=1408 RepID=UPI00081F9E50|nr:hypothetical protein [Bacillus pumilus]AOC57546.1 hypothetical protein BEN31_12375 [Bacillus pumilus]MBR0587717.1 hypothetical protein [Bacillus pumilus DW2J2]MBR0616078.1 hypothetical protein [Bacillus pumilus]MBR0625206.1 hypothetical protein [Bacillus pumilus]MCY7724588.1 hypothetical protein [Bacillus pumilus]
MEGYILLPDVLTNGAITRIIENAWKNNNEINRKDLIEIHKALLASNVFDEIAESISFPMDKTIDTEEKLLEGLKIAIGAASHKKNKQVTLFDEPGIILKDGIYGAAFGKYKYIYRCKGIRIYWFSTGAIEYHLVYATIDENGFSYHTGNQDGWNVYNDEIEDFSSSPMEEALGNGKILISNLIGIKAKFSRDYAIEYLLIPPDVEKLSSFSIQVREEIWNSIIELMKDLAVNSNEEKSNLLKYVLDFIDSINISPAAYHIISLFDFYRENQSSINQNEFIKLFSLIREQSQPTTNQIANVDFNTLIRNIDTIKAGRDSANQYHNLIFECLNGIFQESLKRGKKEVIQHEGRKRIDIVFDNFDTEGFFGHIRDRYKIFCPKIFIECKNYTNDPTNPEIDQLLGRLGETTGKFGILVCRKVDNIELLIKRCKDSMNRDRKYILFLDDNDIKTLLTLKSDKNEEGIVDYLFGKWDRLVLDS